MPDKQIITGQRVHPELLKRAREMRRNMTPAEHRLWQRLRAGRLEGLHFRRQQVIDGYIVDFYCHAASLVVEVDGGVHFGQETYDRGREELLTTRGLRVLRFLNSDVDKNIDTVLAVILSACQTGRATE